MILNKSESCLKYNPSQHFRHIILKISLQSELGTSLSVRRRIMKLILENANLVSMSGY